MKSLNKNQKGFTLIEIMVVIGILVVIISFGATVDFSSLTSTSLQGEQSKIVSVLERARSHSMANMFESKFGVCYVSPNYIIFHDSTCDGLGTDETIPANTKIASASAFTFTSSSPIFFEQLTGDVSAAPITINVTDGVKSLVPITINNEGTINW